MRNAFLARRGCAGAADALGRAQTHLQRGDRLAGAALDQEQGGQFVAAAVVDLGLVGLALVLGVTQEGPVVNDQAPDQGGLPPPLAGQLVQRFDEARQGGGVVVEETMGAEDGSEAVGQSGHGQGVDASGQRIAHAEVLQDELAIAQLQSRLQSGC